MVAIVRNARAAVHDPVVRKGIRKLFTVMRILHVTDLEMVRG
jgi:hypothetical protein